MSEYIKSISFEKQNHRDSLKVGKVFKSLLMGIPIDIGNKRFVYVDGLNIIAVNETKKEETLLKCELTVTEFVKLILDEMTSEQLTIMTGNLGFNSP